MFWINDIFVMRILSSSPSQLLQVVALVIKYIAGMLNLFVPLHCILLLCKFWEAFPSRDVRANSKKTKPATRSGTESTGSSQLAQGHHLLRDMTTDGGEEFDLKGPVTQDHAIVHNLCIHQPNHSNDLHL